MQELDRLVDSTSVDDLMEMDFDNYSEEELEYLLDKIEKKADHECYQVGISYNVRDVELVDRIEDSCGLLQLAVAIAYMAGSNFIDVLGTTKIWDTIIYREMCHKKVCVPPKKQNRKEEYPGAYVKIPIVGLHEWVCSFDMKSLYPNIMVQYNMSPETYIPFEKDRNASVQNCFENRYANTRKEYTMSASGHYFSNRKRGILPEIIVETYDKRIKIQEEAEILKKEREELLKELAELEKNE